ncbi:hypothetical protein QEN19_001344 [Hanseniaspora menglaensis]
MTLNFTIKHAGKSYPVAMDKGKVGIDLKNEVLELTHIPLERQKYMVKGGKLEDDTVLSDKIKEGSVLLVLGTSDKDLINKPSARKIEEMQSIPVSTSKRFKSGTNGDKNDLSFLNESKDSEKPTVGMKNLGNTCYINSTVQALYQIETLRKCILDFKISDVNASDQSLKLHADLVFELKKLFENLKTSNLESVYPISFITKLRSIHEQFKEVDRASGIYKQQDAEELFTLLLNSIDMVIPDALADLRVDMLTKITDTNNKSDVSYKTAEDTKLRCHISVRTNFLQDGLKDSLKERLNKTSEITNEMSKFEYDNKITRLPKFLTVQFVRFFWKKDTKVKSKILRKVTFPFELDVADLLEDSYKKKKIDNREKMRSYIKEREADEQKFISLNSFKKAPEGILKEDYCLLTVEEKKNKWREIYDLKTKSWEDKKLNNILPKDLDQSENPTSCYELQAIIAHQGANSESGHYQAFIRDADDANSWFKYNDDKVIKISREKVEALAGGGEGDSALILIYKGLGL